MKQKILLPFGIILSIILLFNFANLENSKTKAAASEPINTVSVKAVPEEEITHKNNESVTVYITETGDCYHLKSCPCLKTSKIETDLDYAKKYYRPCKRCKPDKKY